MSDEHEREVAAAPALRRRAIVRALASSPVILTISATSARAQQSFGTSLCPLGLRMIISDPNTLPETAEAEINACKNRLGI